MVEIVVAEDGNGAGSQSRGKMHRAAVVSDEKRGAPHHGSALARRQLAAQIDHGAGPAARQRIAGGPFVG